MNIKQFKKFAHSIAKTSYSSRRGIMNGKELQEFALTIPDKATIEIRNFVYGSDWGTLSGDDIRAVMSPRNKDEVK